MTKPPLTIFLARPRGFCAGVERAIGIVEQALRQFGAPVYVRHEIVHNQRVLADLKAKGAVFIKDLGDVPPGAPVVFSAHGVAKSVSDAAGQRRLVALDATCPLVSKVHREAENLHRAGYRILLIGHRGHPEVVGTMGQLPEGAVTLVETATDAEALTLSPAEKPAYITQTTLSVDDTTDIVAVLRRKYPGIATSRKEDICYATSNRQLAVRDIAGKSDLVIVIGSANSSNSNRLVEVARAYGAKRALLADSVDDIPWGDLKGIRTLGLTAGASAPEVLVEEVLDRARNLFDVTLQTVVSVDENVTFRIPRIQSA